MLPVHDTVPRRNPPVVVWSLVGANVAVFALQLLLPQPVNEWIAFHFGLVPARYTDPLWAQASGLSPDNPLPFLTNMFLHGGFAHILGNMWTLWIFGGAVEDRLGRLRFLVLYFASGLAASLMHFATNPTSTIPALGASGAISGVLGAYTVLFPLARIVFVVPILFVPFFFELPALLYTGFWFLLQFLYGTWDLIAPKEGGGVAWWAHIGGFVAGLLLVRLLLVRRRLRRYYPDEGWLGHGPDGRLR